MNAFEMIDQVISLQLIWVISFGIATLCCDCWCWCSFCHRVTLIDDFKWSVHGFVFNVILIRVDIKSLQLSTSLYLFLCKRSVLTFHSFPLLFYYIMHINYGVSPVHEQLVSVTSTTRKTKHLSIHRFGLKYLDRNFATLADIMLKILYACVRACVRACVHEWAVHILWLSFIVEA